MKLKTILTLIAIFLGALGALVLISFIYTAIGYIVILGIVCLGAYIAFKLFGQSDDKQLAAPDHQKELDKAQRLLDNYKRKSLK